MKRLILCALCLCMLSSGCAVYSETAIKIRAKKAKSIAPQVPIGLEEPDCWLVRKTSFSLWTNLKEFKYLKG